MRTVKGIIGITVFAIGITAANAANMSFYADHERGWFFKEEPAKQEQVKVPQCITEPGSIFWDATGVSHSFVRLHQRGLISRDQFGQMALIPLKAVNCDPPQLASPAKPPAPKEKPAEPVQAKPSPPPGPAPLSAKWFRENLDRYKEAAIDDPLNKEKVMAYLYLQRVMMDKAEQFALTYHQVAMGDAFLDETSRFPTATYGAKRFEKIAKEEKTAALNKIGEDAGIFFFIDETCRVCEEQAKVLSLFAKMYDFTIMPVTIDGSRLQGALLPEPLQDSGQSEVMGVSAYPALVLASPSTSRYRPISLGGVLSLDELVKRSLLAAKDIELISSEEYDKTLPSNGSHKLIQTRNNQLTPEVLEDPRLLIEAIKSMEANNEFY